MFLYALQSLSLLFPFYNHSDFGLQLFESQKLIPILTKYSCKQYISCKQHLQPGSSGTRQAKYRCSYFSSPNPCTQQHCHCGQRWEQARLVVATLVSRTATGSLCPGVWRWAVGQGAGPQSRKDSRCFSPPVPGAILEERLIITVFLLSLCYVQTIKEETDGLHEELEFIRLLGTDLIFACGETEKPEVKKSIDEVGKAAASPSDKIR